MARTNNAQKQAIAIRDFAARQAASLSETETNTTEQRLAVAKALRDLTQVWDTACNRLRILSGKPLPGSFKPQAKTKSKSGAPIAEPIFAVVQEKSSTA